MIKILVIYLIKFLDTIIKFYPWVNSWYKILKNQLYLFKDVDNIEEEKDFFYDSIINDDIDLKELFLNNFNENTITEINQEKINYKKKLNDVEIENLLYGNDDELIDSNS